MSGSSTQTVLEQAEVRTKQYVADGLIEPQFCITSTSLQPLAKDLPAFEHVIGKVRDLYVFDKDLLLITTDRQSAFDRALASIPFKSQVLTQTSVWWFNATKHIVPNHLLEVPHPSVMRCKKCKVFSVEFVVRGYITGSTSTSMWTNYQKGCRNFCGNLLPEGFVQHQKLPENLVTPTTKDADHDELISGEEIVASGRMTQQEWDYCKQKTLELFAFGQQQAAHRGLILVDTKYEFGKDADGQICLIDEVHTPDSSRYWVAHSYEQRMKEGKAPESIDKEFLRLWFKERCDPYNDKVLPEAPKELIVELSRRYIMLYELITGQQFDFVQPQDPNGHLMDCIRKSYAKSS